MNSTNASSSNLSKKIKLTIIPPRQLFVNISSDEEVTTIPYPTTASSSPTPPNAPSNSCMHLDRLFAISSKNLTKLINSQISAKDKAGLGYDSQINESEVVHSVFNSRESNVDDSLVNDRFKTVVATKSGQVPVNAAKQSSLRAAASISTARPVNTVAPKSKVNVALPTTYSCFKAHSPVRRAFNQKSAAKINNFNEKVNTARVNNITTAGLKAVVSAAVGNGENAVKSSTCWIWRLTGNVIDHNSKDSGSYMLKRFDYVDLQATSSYIDMEFVALEKSLKEVQITEKQLIKSQVLLKVPRHDNMYSFDIKNVVPLGGLTCLFANATIDESNLWHRRLGHINFKTMNKLVRGNLVRGLPSKLFENDHTCVACQKEKQHKASCKNHSCDNGTEFKNNDMNQFCGMKGIKRKFSVARTPQQSGVAERKNRTLIEAARTMLAYLLLPTIFWAEAVSRNISLLPITIRCPQSSEDAYAEILVKIITDEPANNGQRKVKNGRRAQIKEEVYVCQPPGFEDPQFPDKVYKVEKALYGLHQAPRACQDKYVVDILKKFDFVTVKTTSTLIKTNKALLKDEEAEDVDVHLYRSMIGSLMYLTASRPDIMFAVCTCAWFQVTPKVSHLHAVKRIFRYLKGQPKLGLWLISWQCKKKTIVANSTIEAEYVVVANYCGQVLWIQNQMPDYGFNFMNTKIYIDNESTICIVKNPVFHSKTKNIEIRHHFIRDSYENRLIQVIKIHTDHNVADLFTKAFDVNTIRDKFGNKTGSCKVNATRQDKHIEYMSRMDGRTCNIKQKCVKSQTPRQAKRGRDTKIPQSGGPPEKVGDEAVHKELGDRMERAATTASSLEAEQDSDAQTRIGVDTARHKLNTASINTSKNGEMEITATINGRVKTVTEASIRRNLKINFSKGELFPTMEVEGSIVPVESHHTPTNAPSISQPPTSPPSIQITHVAEEAATMPHDLPLLRVHSLGSDEGSMILHELTILCTTLSKKVESLESDLKQTKLTYGAAYTKFIMKVKKLENRIKSSKARRRVGLNVSEDDLEDPFI
ncbi:putative reverse transcriptase, RNA-dependent DNA polymerase [Tanacetum coccineum]|uniref:Reverse transcriptase, RNA-dependent DNA polymerase n=1 Tax=Tanacetum coccineum TaxID=301880 RepID=A0ABQ5C7M6_9ASTR